MNKNVVGLGFVVGLLGALSSAGAREYNVDPGHSNIGFTVRHMVSKVYGEFSKFDAKLDLDEKKPENSKVDFTVMTDSIDTRSAKRDEHLKSPDFFDAKKFGKMTFVGKKITHVKDKMYTLSGDLTIKDVTKTVAFDVEFLGKDKDPWGGTRAGFTAKAKINRKDFGLSWNKVLESGGMLVGEDVEIALNLEAVEKADAKK